MAETLKVIERECDGTRVISLVGRVDTNTSSMLDAAMRRIYAHDKAPHIVVEMGECSFISSAGLRVIVSMYKHAQRGGSLVFRNVRPEVKTVFDVTDFDKILTFE